MVTHGKSAYRLPTCSMEPTASPPKGIASSLLAAVIDAAGGEPGAGIVQKWPLKAVDCPVYAVTVFTDRAEVTRAISLRPDEIGQHEIIVEGLSELVVADSLR